MRTGMQEALTVGNRKKALTILSNGQIDVHGRARLWELAKKKLQESTISERNKGLILDFLRDCELGKTARNTAKKRIGELRLAKCSGILRQLAEWLAKDLDDVAEKDMEEFILRYEKGEIKQPDGKPYADSTKLTFKKVLIKFFKWLNKGQVPDTVSWIDLSPVSKEIPSLTVQEVQQLISHAATIKTKAFVQFLFDSGARIEECLNIRLKDLTKENDYYKVRIAYSKTKPRTISLPLCTELLDVWLSRHPEKGNTEAQLFSITPRSAWITFKRLAQKAGISKKVSPHVLRHSSATYYCNKLSHYQFCYRYGWAMSSDMPQRYIDRSGINDAAGQAVKNDTVSRLSEENFKLQQDVRLLKDRLDSLDNVMVKLLQETPEAANLLRKVAVKKGLLEELRKHSD